MDLGIYIAGARLDLFSDEGVMMNLNVKDLTDISKLMTDFTQTFNVPASPLNNQVFSHWYDADVDGSFNANVRVPAYIEINGLPYKYGSVQMIKSKMRANLPFSYVITFFAAAVNLSDKFGDDMLKVLPLSAYDHPYNQATVIQAMRDPIIGGGDVYYPLISAHADLNIGSASAARNLDNEDNEITYREFKPALREIRIIEAIEQHYNVKFSRHFFSRSIFWKKHFWLHRDADYMKAFGQKLRVNITTAGSLPEIDVTVDTVNDTIAYYKYQEDNIVASMIFRVTPETGYEDVPYKVQIENNGQEVINQDLTGVASVNFSDGAEGIQNVLKFFVSGTANFQFHTRILVRLKNVPFIGTVDKAATTPTQTSEGYVSISAQMPEMRVRDYFNSLIAQFNLILVPVNETEFIVDTLDNWYSRGKSHDITDLIDVNEIELERADVKRKIDFLYQKTETVLGAAYYTNNGTSYGDLRAEFAEIAGNELKVESQFENMLFERLQNEATGELSDLQAGYAIDKTLQPTKGKPISFYKNGWTYAAVDDVSVIYISGQAISRIYHTATEDDLQIGQVTNSLNFGSDVSSYFYSSIPNGLFANFWQVFVEDLYNRKARVYSMKCRLPIRILYNLAMNDRLIVKNKKYKIATINVNLTDGSANIKVFSDFSAPLDSEALRTPITVDSTAYTVDTQLLTADMVSIHEPVVSFIVNGISRTLYRATLCEDSFEVKVSANSNWGVSRINTGDGNGWFSCDSYSGSRSGYIRVNIARFFPGSYRTGILRFIIGGETFDLKIEQLVNP